MKKQQFSYARTLPVSLAPTSFRKLEIDGVSTHNVTIDGQTRKFLKVHPSVLTKLAEIAFSEISHFLRPSHLASLNSILKDPEASDNDRFVALDLIKNAVVSAGGELPMCQDTGTAIIYAKRAQSIVTDGNDERHLSAGVYEAFQNLNLRYSQLAPVDMFTEVNTETNLPAQIDIELKDGAGYEFLFMAKGGGSANKSFLFQATRSVLEPRRLLDFIAEKLSLLGTAACPPYHLAVVVGGTSAEMTLKTAKLASAHALDDLPENGDPHTGHAIRDKRFEAEILEKTREIGYGAQFGGKYFCHDVRVVRLPRHNGSLPIAIAVSCSADRQILAHISEDGVFIENLEHDPAQYLPGDTTTRAIESSSSTNIDLNQPMSAIQDILKTLQVGDRLSLSGTLVVARDLAHARIREQLERGNPLPDYFKNHPIYYAGPAKTPEGLPSGSFGPTTAARMDPYIPIFQAVGGSLVTLAKGNRSQQVVDSCKKHGGFYLGSIGGPAALLASESIASIEVIDMEELGMEAVWKIDVKDFPAFVVVDDKGNDFFAKNRAQSNIKLGRTRTYQDGSKV